MDLTQNIVDENGEVCTHQEAYKDKNGVNKTRDSEITYYKIVREALIGIVGGRLLNCPSVVVLRHDLFLRIHSDPVNVHLTFTEKILLKTLLAKRFDLSTAAQVIKKL